MTLSAYLPQDRLRALSRGETLPAQTSGSALFADISGFTSLTEALERTYGPRKGGEKLSRHLEDLYSALIAEVERLGGSVLSFAGDSMLCWFDQADGNPVRRAAGCALAMQRAMSSFEAVPVGHGSVAMSLKVSVASGPSRRFAIGDPGIQRLDVLAGGTIARTATAEHHALSGEVLLDEASVKALGDAATIQAWRTDAGTQEHFAVIGESDAITSTAAPPTSMREPKAGELRPWIHRAVFEREQEGQEAFLTEFRPCVALFVRFTGIDYEGAEAEAAIDRFVRSMQVITERHDGALLQLTIGDKGSYAYINFGALSAHEDDARRALKAALELRERTELKLQAGIAQGLMRVGAYGSATRKTYGALGDDVNLAARLMTAAAGGEILLSSHVHQSVQDDFTFEPRPPMPMKGKAEPLPVFAATGEKQKRAMRLQEPSYSLPMVGREDELQLINDKLEMAAEGNGQVIGIVAEAGMGKSRLVAEVIRLARRKGFVGYGGACQSDGQHTPYLAWKSIWGAFFDVDPEMPLKRQIRNIEGEIEDRASDRIEAMPLLNAVLDLNIPDNQFTKTLEPKIRQSALHALLEDCLQAAAQDEPILIVIEDLHWIDALSEHLLGQLARATADSAVCFVLAYRPLDLEHLEPLRLEALPYFTRVELHELTRAEADSAIRAKLAQLYPAREGALPEGLVDTLMARGQGNPFYLEELLNYVRDRGLDPSDLNKIELPDSLHTLILSRIDQLGERERTALRVASIIGRLFHAAWLNGYYPELGPMPEVKSALDQLDNLDITPLDSEPELTYLFKHIVTHEVTYESLQYSTRSRLHLRLARYLEGRIESGSIPATGTLETVASHFERGEAWKPALEWLQRAAAHASERWALQEAVNLYRRALAALEHLPPQAGLEYSLRNRMATAMMFFGSSREDTLKEFESCASLATDARQQAAAYYQMGRLLHIFTSADLASAERHYRYALELLEGQRDELYCSVEAHLGYLYRYQHRLDLSIATLERNLKLAEQLNSLERRADAYLFLSGAYLDAAREDDALTAGENGYAAAKEAGDLELIGRAHSFCADVYLLRASSGRGSPEAALPHINGMLRHGREYGVSVLAGFGAQALGDYDLLKNDRAAALDAWREAADVWVKTPAPTRAAYAYSRCGQILLEMEQVAAANEYFGRTLETCRPAQTNLGEFYVGLAFANTGAEAAAIEHLNRAFSSAPADRQRAWLDIMRSDPEFHRQPVKAKVIEFIDRQEAALAMPGLQPPDPPM
jgi:adenylate cyclase